MRFRNPDEAPAPATAVVASLRKAIAREAEVRQTLTEAEIARADAEAVESAWAVQVRQYEWLEARLKRGRQEVEIARQAVEPAKAELEGHLGGPEERVALGLASNLFLLEGAIPILQNAIAYLEKNLALHVENMREFGKKNGVPADVLKNLPAADLPVE